MSRRKSSRTPGTRVPKRVRKNGVIRDQRTNG